MIILRLMLSNLKPSQIGKRVFFVAVGLVLVTSIPVTFAQNAQPPGTSDLGEITIIVSGTGADEKAALNQALKNAIMQAVATYVDTETILRNDQIISDKVLTASNAVVTHCVPIETHTAQDGLVVVKISAAVRRKDLYDKLVATNVVSRPINGIDDFVLASTRFQHEKDLVPIVQAMFKDFPGNVLKANPVGEPRLLSHADGNATIAVAIRFSVDGTKYEQWYNAYVLNILSKITNIEHRPWNALTFGQGEFPPYVEIPPGLEPSDWKSSNRINDEVRSHRIGWPDQTMDSTIALLERKGGSRVTLIHLDPENKPLIDTVRRAACALPFVDVSLRNGDGKEIEVDPEPALFELRKHLGCYVNVSPFWMRQDNGLETLLPRESVLYDWNPRWSEGILHLWVLPYVCEENVPGSSPIASPGYTQEFRFTLSLDELADLKTVTARIYSLPLKSDSP